MDGEGVVINSLAERPAFDAGALVGVFFRGFAGNTAEVAQQFDSRHHLADGVGAEKVEVDAIEPVGVGAFVASRPFLRVADGTYATEVDGRYEVGLVVLFQQVGERQIRCVRVADMASHNQRESPDFCRPEDIGVAGGLGASFDDALMDGAQFVEVVALVGTRAGVEKREHAGDE